MSALVELRGPLSPDLADQLTPLYDDSNGPSLSFLASLLSQQGTFAWVMYRTQVPVAAAWFRVVLDEAELVDIRVSGHARRAGIGRRLLTESLQCISGEGANCCHLEVRRSNMPALALYQQIGFEVIGERANYYRVQDGVEDAILMRCQLEQSER